MKCAFLGAAVLNLVMAAPAAAQVTSEIPCTFGPYEQQPGLFRRAYSADEYDRIRSNKGIECRRITYLSDGLRVVGFIVRPLIAGRRLPLIVFNRGGLLDIGKIDTPQLLNFYHLASEGFVIAASQYRGNDGGEGQEEFGGADVSDVINLRNLAASLPYVDASNVFFYGLSRGAMMTFLALRRGATVNAVAVVGGLFDVEQALEPTKKRAPGIVERVMKLIPDYGTAALRDRSVIQSADQVTVPVLILHGGTDEEVPPAQALAFASRLEDLRKPYEIVVYANDTHEITNNRQDRDARIIAWFRRRLQ